MFLRTLGHAFTPVADSLVIAGIVFTQLMPLSVSKTGITVREESHQIRQ